MDILVVLNYLQVCSQGMYIFSPALTRLGNLQNWTTEEGTLSCLPSPSVISLIVNPSLNFSDNLQLKLSS